MAHGFHDADDAASDLIAGAAHSRTRPLWIGLIALALTLATSLIQRPVATVQDWDCPPAPASCERAMQAAGLPLPYLYDYHGLSPVGSVDLVGALLGLDLFVAWNFAVDLLFWLLLTTGSALLFDRLRRTPSSGGAPPGSG